MKNVCKFVSWDIPALETLKGSFVYDVMGKLNSGEKLSSNEKEHLTNLFEQSGERTGRIKLSGWCFDFKPYLKAYWVKTEFAGIFEVYAFNKTLVRKHVKYFGKVCKIVEIN